jgi:hypothetical protein
LHKSEKGEAFADKNPDLTDKSGRKCFAPTAKNRLLQEVYLTDPLKAFTVEPSEIFPDKTSLVSAAQKAIATVAAIGEIQRGKV